MHSGEFFGRRLHARRANGLSFDDSLHAPASTLAPHAHSNSFLALVAAGEYRETIDGMSYERRGGDVVLHRAGEIHANRVGDHGARVISIELGPEWMARMSCLDVDTANRSGARMRPTGRFAPRLAREIRAGDQASVLALESLTLEILSEWMRAREHAGRRRGSQPWLERVRTALEERYREPLTLAVLAEVADVHPVHLAREFRRTFGCTVGEQIRRLRVDHACRELEQTSDSIADIAARAGFSDHSHLARLVRAYTGCSPRELRRLGRG